MLSMRRAYITPPYGLRAEGPLITGGCEGAASGAGIRFSKVGLGGGDAPKRVVGLRTKLPPSPSPTPPRASKCTTPPTAKPGVEPTTQAAATNTAAKMRFMIAIPNFVPPLDAVESNQPRD